MRMITSEVDGIHRRTGVRIPSPKAFFPMHTRFFRKAGPTNVNAVFSGWEGGGGGLSDKRNLQKTTSRNYFPRRQNLFWTRSGKIHQQKRTENQNTQNLRKFVAFCGLEALQKTLKTLFFLNV